MRFRNNLAEIKTFSCVVDRRVVRDENRFSDKLTGQTYRRTKGTKYSFLIRFNTKWFTATDLHWLDRFVKNGGEIEFPVNQAYSEKTTNRWLPVIDDNDKTLIKHDLNVRDSDSLPLYARLQSVKLISSEYLDPTLILGESLVDYLDPAINTAIQPFVRDAFFLYETFGQLKSFASWKYDGSGFEYTDEANLHTYFLNTLHELSKASKNGLYLERMISLYDFIISEMGETATENGGSQICYTFELYPNVNWDHWAHSDINVHMAGIYIYEQMGEGYESYRDNALDFAFVMASYIETVDAQSEALGYQWDAARNPLDDRVNVTVPPMLFFAFLLSKGYVSENYPTTNALSKADTESHIKKMYYHCFLKNWSQADVGGFIRGGWGTNVDDTSPGDVTLNYTRLMMNQLVELHELAEFNTRWGTHFIINESISNIQEKATDLVEVTHATAGTIAFKEGDRITIEGTTNYNGTYVITTIVSSTIFEYSDPQTSRSSESSGNAQQTFEQSIKTFWQGVIHLYISTGGSTVGGGDDAMRDNNIAYFYFLYVGVTKYGMRCFDASGESDRFKNAMAFALNKVCTKIYGADTELMYSLRNGALRVFANLANLLRLNDQVLNYEFVTEYITDTTSNKKLSDTRYFRISYFFNAMGLQVSATGDSIGFRTDDSSPNESEVLSGNILTITLPSDKWQSV